MQWFMTLRIALRALARNKLRAFLTMLGIIIGVGAVIAMVAIGEGAKATIRSQIASLGTNLLIVLPGSQRARRRARRHRQRRTLWWTPTSRRSRRSCRPWLLLRRCCANRTKSLPAI